MHTVAGTISTLPSISPGLFRRFNESDLRKRLWVDTSLSEQYQWAPSIYFGCQEYTKVIPGASLTQISHDFAKFDVEKYTSVSNLFGIDLQEL